MKRISVIVPVYNEMRTLPVVLREIADARMGCFEKEVIVVDDGSTDGSREFLSRAQTPNLRALFLEKNQGKGAAIKKGLEVANGDYILIQDADMEYSPGNYSTLVEPLSSLSEDHFAVFGSRVLRRNRRNGFYRWNRMLTALFNVFFHTRITDFSTCYKIFPRFLIPQLLRISHNDFVFDVLYLTLAIARSGLTIKEVPIDYAPRSYRDGKKLRPFHGIRIFYYLCKERFIVGGNHAK